MDVLCWIRLATLVSNFAYKRDNQIVSVCKSQMKSCVISAVIFIHSKINVNVLRKKCNFTKGVSCKCYNRCLLWTWFTRKCLPKHAFGGSSGFVLGDLNADCRYIATHRKRHAKKCHAQNATVYALTFMQVFEWMLLPRSWNSTASLCIVVNRFLRGHHHNSQLLCLWPVYYRYVLKLTTICSL